ncbi:type II toxin-antitoxin system VapC family toxin [Kribbella deserti]|uniref:Ribonuclease VapC n=1 Tax=Kribbella deserti TaxID=1926257 RepID=A0ABV6QT67_9ACTN
MIVVDTGPLVAAALSGDNNHSRCVELFTSIHLNGERMVIPPLVVTEVCYLLEREAGAKVESEFVRSLAAGDFVLAELDQPTLARTADLISQYADLPLGAVDASVVAIAEQLGVQEIATLDRRHFSAVRPRHIDAFTLLP